MCYIISERFYAGEGNQLFVYLYGIIISNIFDIPYIHPGIPSLNILGTLNKKENNNLKYIKIINYQEFLENNTLDKNYNYILDYGFNPTIEDYKIFLPHIDFLRNYFPKQEVTYKSDLVYHLRGGDVLLCNGNNYKYFNGEKLKNVIDDIKYERLYVVTNLKKHETWTMKDLLDYKDKLIKYGDCGANYTNDTIINSSQMEESLSNLNGVIKVLNDRNAIWKSDTILNDFNFIRSFDKIMIGVSTYSWWAAILSNAKEVYAPKNWKYLKGDRNKNLPFVELDNWKALDY
ncbi:MAG: hypothetical protein CMD14_09120 [Flavobacteriales bacterium]|nr:hypothetical protein [Flavobacteriales bacterium]|tara:strand:- start:17883 stop:18749 length:867 start_codon:yes stop_codon:yes gene_type:complete